MVEPHIFCGPEFVLEVPRAQAENVLERHFASSSTTTAGESDGSEGGGPAVWTARAQSLLIFQSELYSVCTPGLRRRLHRPTLTSQEGRLAMQNNNAKEVAKMLMFSADGTSGASATAGLQQQHRLTGSAPAAPDELRFLTAKTTNPLTREEEASLAQTIRIIHGVSAPESTPSANASSSLYVPLLVTDSRMAGELYLLCLRNTSIALSSGCRLYNYYRATARGASLAPAEILRRKEAQRAQYNLDKDLWSALELAVTPELIEDVLARQKRADVEGDRYPAGRILTPREEHQQKVEALLMYCDATVSFAGVLDTNEEASPLLIAMGLFFRLQLTLTDLYTHFVRHPRRAVRALALLIARYTVAPEELPPFFYPSLHDGVVIATTQDALVTCQMSEFAEAALTKDEVSEAWLPVYHPFFMETVVAPAAEGMTWLWGKQLEARQQRRARITGDNDNDNNNDDATTTSVVRGSAAAMADGVEVEEEDGVPLTRARALAASGITDALASTSDEVRGSGRGVGALGFKNLRELNDFARRQERSLLPQRMAMLLASRSSRRRQHEDALAMLSRDDGGEDGDAEDLEYSDSDAATNSSDEDFLIHVEVNDGDTAGPGQVGDVDGDVGGGGHRLVKEHTRRGNHPRQVDERPLQGKDGETPRKARRREERLDPHAAVLKEGYRAVLDLLGRRQPFNRRDERYLEF